MSLTFTILLKRILNHIWVATSSLLGALHFQIPRRKTKIRTILQICHRSKKLLKDTWHRADRIRYQDKGKSNKMTLFLSPLSRAWESNNNSINTKEIIIHSLFQIITCSTWYLSPVANSKSKRQIRITNTPNTSWLMTSMGRQCWVRLPTQPTRRDTIRTTTNSRWQWWRHPPFTHRMTLNHYRPMLQ